MDTGEVWAAFDRGADDESVDRVREALTEAGLDGIVTGEAYSLVASGGQLAHDLFLILSVNALQPLLASLRARFADAVVERSGRLVIALRRARPQDVERTELILRGESDGPDVVISPDDPLSALGELLLLSELPPAPSGALVYDRTHRRWQDRGA